MLTESFSLTKNMANSTPNPNDPILTFEGKRYDLNQLPSEKGQMMIGLEFTGQMEQKVIFHAQKNN